MESSMDSWRRLTVLALLVVGSSAHAQIEVSESGSPDVLRGEFGELNESALVVSESGVERSIPRSNLRRLRFVAAAPLPATPRVVHLRDGSQFFAETLASDGQTLTMTLASGTTVAVEPRFVSDIRLRELTEAQAVQWQAFRDSRITADMLILIRSEEALDKIEGVIGKVSADAVSFEFDGQTIPAPITKLAGLRFFSATPPQPAKLAAVVRDVGGNTWMANQLVSPAGSQRLELRLRCGVQLSLPRAELAEIDFSVGSQKYVADLQPLSRESVARLAVTVPGAEQLFGVRAITESRGRALQPSLEFLGSGSATYRIPKEFSRLVGKVELSPPGTSLTPCRVSILLEKQVIWEERLNQSGQLRSFDLPVTEDQRLQLVVQADSPTPVGDVVIFHELRFLK